MNNAILSRTMLNTLATTCVALALALAVAPATAQDRTRVGTLTCNTSPGVGLVVGGQRQLSCIYASARAREAYEGTVSTLGLDIGATTGGQLVWAVFAPTKLPRAALAGTFTGATAGGTVGAGASANVLVGGPDRRVIMQPVSVQGQTGVNVAAGVSTMELRPATAPARRMPQ